MRFKEYKYLVSSDLYRTTGDVRLSLFLRHVLAGELYQYVFWMRTCLYARDNPLLRIVLYPLARVMLRRYKFKHGIQIPFTTRIGSGLRICHFGGIVVNGGSVIGKNCNLFNGVTLAQGGLGEHLGFPTIGDNTFVGPGAKVVGAVRVGNNVVIGANSVVTKDVPDNAVVVGAPARVVSYAGSKDYIRKTDYEVRLRQ